MTFSELITSIVLGIMGVSLIALFLRIFLQALSLHFGGSPNSFFNKFQKQDFTKRALRMFKLKLLNAKHFDPKLLEEANKALQAEEINRAIDLFRKCFVLQPFFSDPEAFKTTHQHNLKLLARVVEVARDRGTRVENAALLEGLFQSRGELFLSYFETEHAKEEFRRNRKSQGKSTPRWGENEFDKKLELVKEKVETNQRTLDRQLDEMVQFLKETLKQHEVVYH